MPNFFQSIAIGIALLILIPAASTFATEDLTVGDPAPDFVVTTQANKQLKLSEQLKTDGKPVILLFSRANW